MVSLLSSKGNKDELLSRLKTPRWESKCRLIVKQEKEEEVESKVDEKAEDKRWTLESGRPAKSIRGTTRWKPFKSGLKEVDVRLPDRRSREAKKGFLQQRAMAQGQKLSREDGKKSPEVKDERGRNGRRVQKRWWLSGRHRKRNGSRLSYRSYVRRGM